LKHSGSGIRSWKKDEENNSNIEQDYSDVEDLAECELQEIFSCGRTPQPPSVHCSEEILPSFSEFDYPFARHLLFKDVVKIPTCSTHSDEELFGEFEFEDFDHDDFFPSEEEALFMELFSRAGNPIIHNSPFIDGKDSCTIDLADSFSSSIHAHLCDLKMNKNWKRRSCPREEVLRW